MNLLTSVYHAWANHKGILDLYYEQLFPGTQFFNCRLSNPNIKTFKFGKGTIAYGLFAPGSNLIVGENVYFNGNTRIHSEDSVSIGNNCRIAHDVFITTEDHAIGGKPAKKAPVTIGNRVWIGRGVTILKGVSIGDNSVVGAGAVVTKSIPANEVWGGVPAKFIKKTRD